MGKWLLAASILFLGGAMVATDVEARRLGGARSMGAQRNVTAPPAQTPAKPAQQAAPAQAAPGAAAAAAPRSGLARWFPMLGGLALGGMLGWLLASNGGSFLLLILLAVGAMLLFRAFARRGEAQTMQYAGGPRETVTMPPAGQSMPAHARPGLPAGFDAAGFLRGAKMNFVRLQMANDAGDVEQLREFTTPEMFEALAADLRSRAGTPQHTEVTGLEADVLEVATEGDRHWASVRFSGMVREHPGAQAEPFQEIWNLAKPADGSTGWLLAGIQQVN
ncbi:MAG TPA: Tim44-like domain-containing protein [Burkholderiales bacterium]|nr:Tim44-like domain-containing protein [Burkholderiales bacterium]